MVQSLKVGILLGIVFDDWNIENHQFRPMSFSVEIQTENEDFYKILCFNHDCFIKSLLRI